MSEKVLPRDVAAQDVARLLEGRADVAAGARLIGLLDPTEPLQAVYIEALKLTVARLEGELGALLGAVIHNSVELTQTGEASAAMSRALDALSARYKHLRGQVENSYLNVDPDLKISAAELEQRQRVFDRAFAVAPALFARLNPADQVERGGVILALLEEQGALVDDATRSRFVAEHAALSSAQADWQRERKEDLDATSALNVKRADYDRQARGHHLLVEAALFQIGRLSDVGQFIKQREPGYASRRAAGASIVAEPEVDDSLIPAP